MKRWQTKVLGTCMLLMLLSGVALAQAQDIAPGHWAYQAVQTLIQRGYLDVEADGMFNGEQAVRRYDFAVALARMLSDIEQGKVQISAGADVELLRQLEREFRDELVQWYAERDKLEAAYGQTQRQIAVIDEQLNLLLLSLDELNESVRSRLAANATRTDELLESMDKRIANLQQAVLASFGEYGQSIASQFDEHLSIIGSLQRDVEHLHSLTQSQSVTLDELDGRLNRVNDNAAALAFRLNELEEQFLARLDATDAEMARLHDVMGTSEEQIARMTERVRVQLDDQLALALSRERQLERQLRDLQAELDGYKVKAQEEIRSARGMSTIALSVAAVAVVLALVY